MQFVCSTALPAVQPASCGHASRVLAGVRSVFAKSSSSIERRSLHRRRRSEPHANLHLPPAHRRIPDRGRDEQPHLGSPAASQRSWSVTRGPAAGRRSRARTALAIASVMERPVRAARVRIPSATSACSHDLADGKTVRATAQETPCRYCAAQPLSGRFRALQSHCGPPQFFCWRKRDMAA